MLAANSSGTYIFLCKPRTQVNYSTTQGYHHHLRSPPRRSQIIKKNESTMSYNSGLGNSRIPSSSRDRDRDRPRDRPPSSKPPIRDRDRGHRGSGSVSAFGPGLTSTSEGHDNSFRRHEPQRDYFGYRGNYRKPGFNQGGRKRDSYDKYRPGNKNKAGPSGPRNSWHDKRKPGSSNMYGDRPRPERSEYKPPKDLEDDDRRLNRRPDWDPRDSRDSKDPREGRDRYELRIPQASRDLLSLRRTTSEAPRLNDKSSKLHRFSDPSPSVPLERPKKDDGALTSDTKVQQVAKKPSRVPIIKDERLLHLFDDDEPEPSASLETPAQPKGEPKKPEGLSSDITKKTGSVAEKPEGEKSDDKVEPKTDIDTAKPKPEKQEQSSTGTSKTSDSEPTKPDTTTKSDDGKLSEVTKNEELEKPAVAKKEEEAKKADNDKQAEEAKQTAEATKVETKEEPSEPLKNEKDESEALEHRKRDSVHSLALEPEKPLPDIEEDADDSEAETVITNEPISTDKAKLLVRKRGADEERRRLKRKIIYSDESDDENDDDHSYRPSSASQKHSEDTSTSLEKHTTPSLPFRPRRRSSDDAMKVVDSTSSKNKGGDSADNSDAESEREDAAENKKVFKLGFDQSSKPLKSYKMKRDSTGRSLLQRACKKGDLDAVKTLIARGADANESDFGGFTCLHEAALAGHTDIVKFLIEKGADVNKQALEAGDSETPLMDASENKHVDTVKVLLAHGADPNITNVDGFSALTKLYHLQTEEDNYDEVISLLSVAADKKLTLKAISQSPRKVIEDPNEGYFNDLTKKKSPLSAIYKYVAQGLKEAAAEDFILHGYSLLKKPDILILAARYGHTELVDILLGLNPGSFDINLKNKVGVTILLASVGRGNYDVVKLLLSRGADPLLTRDEDGLNALQISKHSAQHDPREVFLIEQHLSGETEKAATPVPPSSPTPAGRDRETKISQPSDESIKSHDKPALEANEDGPKSPTSKPVVAKDSISKKRKGLEDLDLKKFKKRKEAVEATVNDATAAGEEAQELEKTLLGSPTGEIKEKSPEAEQKVKMNRTASSASLSPGPATKAQEEQKQKALEEAKIWQEKVQAKKRARKEMFLQAEKEKERKRKEDEEKRIELEKQEKLKAKEEEIKKAQEAEKLAKDLESKRRKLEIDLILEKYPIGLRQFIFGERLGDAERLRYCPLYVFDLEGNSYVIDLQISLLLARPVSELHEKCLKDTNEKSILDAEAKAKVWPLFFPMVGVGKNNQVEMDGHAKFLGLQLSFLPYKNVAEYVKTSDAELHDNIWSLKRETKVSLMLLPVATGANPGLPESSQQDQEKGPEAKAGFVPPKWKLRQDVIRTISSAHTPLW